MESKDLWFCLICWPTILKSFEGGSKYIFLLSVPMSGRGKELHGCFTVKGKDFKVHCIPLNASENFFFLFATATLKDLIVFLSTVEVDSKQCI